MKANKITYKSIRFKWISVTKELLIYRIISIQDYS